ncbi:hypothetical protein [Moraxella oblonga]|uniref:hypothetical protein n=1 Tax=Moraxella oblonga TaxID=200413 RepID=UPI0008370235|nr:hypothetical protein [Moraxella oblonga]
MAREWDKFTNANLNSLSPEVQQKLLNYRQTLQKGMDEAGDILSDYITRNPHLKKVWEGQDNDKILNQLVSSIHPDYNTYGGNLASVLNKVFSGELFIKLVLDDVENSEKGMQKALGNWLIVLEG